MPGALSAGRRLVQLSACAALLLVGAASPTAAQDADPEQRAAAIFAEADAYLRLGQTAEASSRLELLLQEYPANRFPDLVWRAAARVRRGDLRARQGTPGAAVDYIGVIDLEPSSAWTSRARIRLAQIVLTSGDWIGAADLLQRVVDDAVAGSPAADASSTGDARRRLALLHRFRIRAAGGELPWSMSSRLRPGDPPLERPIAVAAADDGQLLVVDEGIPAVVLLDAAHAVASRLSYNDHTRPWWGADGLPYLPTRRSGVIALGGSRLGFLANESGRSVPLKDLQSGARTPQGMWFLLDHDPRRVIAFDAAGTYIGIATAARDEPADVAVDAAGRLHFLDREAGSVVRFDKQNERNVVVSARWRRPEALEVDALGNIYVLDRDARAVYVFNRDGIPIQALGPILPGGIELRGPRDIAVDGSGRIYIADRSLPAVVLVQ
jgi:hypothetical protein